jgi:pyruvate dehydrogenase E1 component subunit beta
VTLTEPPHSEADPKVSGRHDILMPKLSSGEGGATILRWHVSEGQTVAEGDILADVATNRTTLEIEAAHAGQIEKILAAAGTAKITPGTAIAILATTESDGASSATGKAAPVAATRTSSGKSRSRPQPRQPSAETTVSLRYREALRDAITEEMRRNSDIVLIGVDVAQNRGAYRVTQGLLDEFGDQRILNAPPLEDAFVGVALGTALGGLRPIVEVSSWSGALEALHHILGTAAETYAVSANTVRLPIVFRGPNGWAPGLAGTQGQCFASLFAGIPGLAVVAPANPADAKGLLKQALRSDGPVIVLEHEMLYPIEGQVPAESEHLVPIGKAKIARAGHDITIVSYSHAVHTALGAAKLLADDGVEAEVVDLRSLRPLDIETVAASVSKTKRLLTVEDGWPAGSIGSEVCAEIAARLFGRLAVPPVRLAGRDEPLLYAEALEEQAFPTAQAVARRARAMIAESN